MPSIRASEFAHEFARAHLETDVTVGAGRLMKNLDESLKEVREVLTAMPAMNMSDVNEQCWCYTHVSERTQRMVSRNDHWPICERARALYRRLQLEGHGG